MTFRWNVRSVLKTILFAAVALALCGAPQANAQVTGGTISGTVKDSTGGVVPNAQVSIANTATNVVTTATTGSEGFYSVPNLLAGSYRVTVTAGGFSTAVVTGVTLNVGAQQAVNITLAVGETSQQVEVTASALNVDLVSSAISAVVVGEVVRELPLNGRSWTDLAQLQPGLNNVTTQPGATTSDRASRGWGAVLAIAGGRGTGNNYRLNGVSLNDSFNVAPGSFTTGNLGVDAIGEFSVLTGNFSAEYGKASGGVINAISRSGTNQIHGTAFEFFRNKVFDAKNFFNPQGAPIPPFVRNQFGAALGGPIRKDKMFVFGNYEGLREALSTTKNIVVPSLTARQGLVCAGTFGLGTEDGCATLVPVPIVQPSSGPALTSLPGLPYVNLWPAPTTVTCPFSSCVAGAGNVGRVTTVLPGTTSENYFTTRVDQKFSDNDTLFGSYTRDRQSQYAQDPLGALATIRQIFRQTYTVEESHTFSPSMINVVRFGFHRQLIENPSTAEALNPIAGDRNLGLATGETIGRIQPGSGIEAFPGGLTLFQTSKNAWNAYQIYDDLFITKGKHALKVGFALEKDERNTSGPGGFAGGRSIFANYTSFLQGSPSSLIANAGLNNPGCLTCTPVVPPSSAGDLSNHLRQWIYGGYFQDDIRLRPNLTINVGMRYEFATTISAKNGVVSSLQCQTCAYPIMSGPPTDNPLLQAVINFYNPTPIYGPITSPNRWNWAPRVGFAWDPFGTGKTSVRASYGIYDVLIQLPQYGSAIGNSWPGLVSTNSGSIPAASWPKGPVSAGNININTKRTNFMQQNIPRSYAQQFNLSVQHQVTPTLTAQVAYQGSRTIHNNMQMNDSNIRMPDLTSGQPLWQCGTPTNGPGVTFQQTIHCPLFPSAANLAGPNASLITPQLNQFNGRMPSQYWNSNALYDALQVGVTKTMGHGLMFKGSYTLSKLIDTGSGSGISDPYVNALVNFIYFWDPKLRRGLSDTDMRNNFVFSYNYEIPSPGSGLLKAIAGGWQTGAIFTVQSGLSFTPRIGGDGADSLGMGSTDAINWPDIVPGCNTRGTPVDRLDYVNVNCYVMPATVSYNGSTWLRTGTANRNATITGPGIVNVNFSLFKNNYIPQISETTNLQFRFEVFNLANRTNFLIPFGRETLFNPDGSRAGGAGRLGETTTTNRQMQFALKLIF